MSYVGRGIFLLLILLTLLLVFTLQNAGANEVNDGEDGIIADTRGLPISEQLREAFHTLSPEQVPTGILLDAGSVFFEDLVRSNTGERREGESVGMTANDFRNAYFDLAKSALFTQLPTLAALEMASDSASEQHEANALTIAIIDYDVIGNENLSEADFDDYVYQPRTDGPVGSTEQFVGAAVLDPVAIENGMDLVIPASAIVQNDEGGREKRREGIQNISLQVGESTIRDIALDKPFTVLHTQPDTNNQIHFTLKFEGERGENYETPVVVDVIPPVVDPRGADPCYDMPPVTASIPFEVEDAPEGYDDPYGTIDIRILTGEGEVHGASNGTNKFGCHTGGDPELQCAAILVTGFANVNQQGFSQVQGAFGDVINQIKAIGYDVILFDYSNGRDYIQRNGFAIREFLVNQVADWMAEGQEDCVAVIGASMGSQTARYGMRSAEIDGEDHHVGLFISLDGPYAGANIPIGLQAAIDFLAPEVGAIQDILPILDSPAASQQLRRNRVSVPWWPLPLYYVPKPEFTAYYSEVDAMGLPVETRNVGVANGSGVGTLQNSGIVERIGYIDEGNFWWSLEIDAKTDHNGEVFYGKIRKVIFTRSMLLNIGNAEFVDIAPGGYGALHQHLVQIANEQDYDASYELDHYDFIPTTSALFPPFDATYAHKCNTEHVVGTDFNGISFVLAELQAFIDGDDPPSPPTPYENPCGVAEPGDPLPPHASCTATPNFGIGQVYSTLDSAGSWDPDGTIVSYDWDLGDAGSATDSVTSAWFVNDGDTTMIFDVTLTVTDNDGLTDQAYCPVEVQCEIPGPWECP